MTASATRVAAMMVREKALDMAAELMQAPVSSLDIVNGEVVRTDRKGGPSMTLGQISAALLPHSKVRGNREPNLSAEGWYYADHQVYPYGDHLAVVKVDPDTGGVKVERYVIAYDIGRAINPMLVKGQIAGGFAQGLGGALLEEFTYSENGDPLAVTFADYLMPTVKETPDDTAIRCLMPGMPLPRWACCCGCGWPGCAGLRSAVSATIALSTPAIPSTAFSTAPAAAARVSTWV